MGKKKRSGVLWSQDASSGSPLGQDVKQWDGVSRTTKRTQKRDEISQRREQVVKASALKDEELAYALQALKETWTHLNEYSREIAEEDLDHVLSQIHKLKDMKKSGAKQRQVKHITASLGDPEWALLEKLLDFALDFNA